MTQDDTGKVSSVTWMSNSDVAALSYTSSNYSLLQISLRITVLR